MILPDNLNQMIIEPEMKNIAVRGIKDDRYSVLAYRNRSIEGIAHGVSRYYRESLEFEKDNESTPFESDIDRIEQSQAWKRLQGIYQFNVPVHLDRHWQY